MDTQMNPIGNPNEEPNKEQFIDVSASIFAGLPEILQKKSTKKNTSPTNTILGEKKFQKNKEIPGLHVPSGKISYSKKALWQDRGLACSLRTKSIDNINRKLVPIKKENPFVGITYTFNEEDDTTIQVVSKRYKNNKTIVVTNLFEDETSTLLRSVTSQVERIQNNTTYCGTYKKTILKELVPAPPQERPKEEQQVENPITRKIGTTQEVSGTTLLVAGGGMLFDTSPERPEQVHGHFGRRGPGVNISIQSQIDLTRRTDQVIASAVQFIKENNIQLNKTHKCYMLKEEWIYTQNRKNTLINQEELNPRFITDLAGRNIEELGGDDTATKAKGMTLMRSKTNGTLLLLTQWLYKDMEAGIVNYHKEISQGVSNYEYA